MHGTGTSLGDPIEIGACSAVLGRFKVAGLCPPLMLTAFKSSIGHAEPAAGVAKLPQEAWRARRKGKFRK